MIWVSRKEEKGGRSEDSNFLEFGFASSVSVSFFFVVFLSLIELSLLNRYLTVRYGLAVYALS